MLHCGRCGARGMRFGKLRDSECGRWCGTALSCILVWGGVFWGGFSRMDRDRESVLRISDGPS